MLGCIDPGRLPVQQIVEGCVVTPLHWGVSVCGGAAPLLPTINLWLDYVSIVGMAATPHPPTALSEDGFHFDSHI